MLGASSLGVPQRRRLCPAGLSAATSGSVDQQLNMLNPASEAALNDCLAYADKRSLLCRMPGPRGTCSPPVIDDCGSLGDRYRRGNRLTPLPRVCAARERRITDPAAPVGLACARRGFATVGE